MDFWPINFFQTRTQHYRLGVGKDAQVPAASVEWVLVETWYKISKQQNERFVDVTNDNNLIHRTEHRSRSNDHFQNHTPP